MYGGVNSSFEQKTDDFNIFMLLFDSQYVSPKDLYCSAYLTYILDAEPQLSDFG